MYRIPKSISSKWIQKLNKDNLYMTSGLDVQIRNKKYKVYLERYEKDGTWEILPHGILFVFNDRHEVCRIGYNFDINEVTWTTAICEEETA